jgi:uncharacterized protein (DUF2141 family)
VNARGARPEACRGCALDRRRAWMSWDSFSRVVLIACTLCMAVLGPASARADAVPPGALSVRLVGLRNDHGRSGCELFASEKGFPTDSKAALQRVWCPIDGTESICHFGPVSPGTYAIACFHDENGNGECDTGFLGIPTEGTVVSNEAKGFMGAPKFKDAKFSFLGHSTELRLRMGY